MGMLFYGIRYTPAGEKKKVLAVASSSSCFGSFPSLTSSRSLNDVIDNRMFFSTYYTREQFNEFVKAMREEFKDGFDFKYANGTVRHFDRPTIGFYEHDSVAKGYCDEFAKMLHKEPLYGYRQNYVSLTVDAKASGLEAFAMIKLMTKQLSSPQSYQAEFPIWQKAYKETGSWMMACIVCCNAQATAGYMYPVGLGIAYQVIGKDWLHGLLNRKGPLELPGHEMIMHTHRPFTAPVTVQERQGLRSDPAGANTQLNRVLSTSATCFPRSNPTDIPRTATRELVQPIQFTNSDDRPTKIKKITEFLINAKQGIFS